MKCPVSKFKINMRSAVIGSAIACVLFSLTGCKHTENAAMITPLTEDFVSPPNEPRYTQPPESAYRNPPQKKAWGAPAPGGGGPVMQ
jgi:hypothetical protein